MLKNLTRLSIHIIIAFLILLVGANLVVILAGRSHMMSEAAYLARLAGDTAGDTAAQGEGRLGFFGLGQPSFDEIGTVDAIIVLGSGIWGDYPTPLLAERLDTAIALYKAGASDLLIMSGDGENPGHHDEPLVMANYAMARGVPEAAIRLDRFGLNTHATVYRAIHKYDLKRVIFVSQHYHLERTLYLSQSFGLDGIGVYCDKRRIAGQTARDVREVFARIKDFFVGLTRVKPDDERILQSE